MAITLLRVAIVASAIIGSSTGLTTRHSRALFVGTGLALVRPAVWVLGSRYPGWIWATVPGISLILAVICVGQAALDRDNSAATGWLGVGVFFAVHSSCAVFACVWAWRTAAAPPELRAKGAEAVRLLSAPLVLAVILAVLPDALGDELFVPFLSLLVVSCLVIVLGSGYTSAVPDARTGSG